MINNDLKDIGHPELKKEDSWEEEETDESDLEEKDFRQPSGDFQI